MNENAKLQALPVEQDQVEEEEDQVEEIENASVFLTSSSYQRRISQDFLPCMCQSSVSGAIHTVIEALNQIMQHWIEFPTEHLDIELIKQQFWIHCGFPGVTGAIDGTHIAIWPPNKERKHLYINRKLYHSLNVLIASII
ncbi:putative nuclease HARBI1 [Temnothorax nylanderi]|uniref:putative nuclease HARBI1 n=1 Tax=Temnothorax nylanderi TaxID=102681 RepID=UPI003A86613D